MFLSFLGDITRHNATRHDAIQYDSTRLDSSPHYTRYDLPQRNSVKRQSRRQPEPQNTDASAGADTGAGAGTDRAMASRVEALEALVKRAIGADKTTDNTGTRNPANTAMIVDVNREDINVDVLRGMGMALDTAGRNGNIHVDVSNMGFFASASSSSTTMDPVRLSTSGSIATPHPGSSHLLHPSYTTSTRTPGPDDDDDDTGRALSMAMPDSLSRDQQADGYHGDGFQDTLDDFMVRPSDDDQIDPSSLTRMSVNLDAITEEPSVRELSQQHSNQRPQSDSTLTTTGKRQVGHDQHHHGRLDQTHSDQEGFGVGSSSMWPPHATHDSRMQIPLASNPHPEHRGHSGGGGLRFAERQSQSGHVGFGAGSDNETERIRVGRLDLNLGLDQYQGGGTDLGSQHHPVRGGASSSPASEGELGDGTLVISASGRSKYVGPTAGSEWLVDVSRSRLGPENHLCQIRGS
jgi:hypothetical protein